MLDTLDFTGSEQWASFNFFSNTAFVHFFKQCFELSDLLRNFFNVQ